VRKSATRPRLKRLHRKKPRATLSRVSINRAAAAVTLLIVSGCQPGGADSTTAAADSVPVLSSAIRVKVESVVETGISGSGDVTGVVGAFRKATVAAEVGGRVVRRAVEPGEAVEAGDLLVELDRERARLNVQQAQSRVNSQRVDVAHAQHEYRRAQELIAREVISQDVLDDLRFAHQRAVAELGAGDSALATAQRALRDTRVVAPFSGTAEVVHVQEGDYLTPGTPVALITDFSKARVRAGVTAADAALIDTGGQASLGFEALGGARLHGTIHSVSRIKDPASGTYAVEIWLEAAAAERLREGMVAAVQLPYATEAAKPTVPKSALFRKDGELKVFTVVDDIAISKPVRIGRSRGEVVQVVEGLSVGEQVVVDGLFALRDGAPVVTETVLP
jgi:membrane fusion protein (multidrug efflux system)